MRNHQSHCSSATTSSLSASTSSFSTTSTFYASSALSYCPFSGFSPSFSCFLSRSPCTTTLSFTYSSLSSCYSVTKTSYLEAILVMGGGGIEGGGGFAFWLSLLTKSSLIRSTPFLPHLLSLTSMGRPNQRSSVQTWQIFLSLLQEEQTQVRLQTPLFPRHLKTVKGRKQILHSCPQFYLSILMQGFSPQHLSQATGKSDVYHPCLFIPVRVARPRSLFIQTLIQYALMSKPSLGHMVFRRQLSKLEKKIVQEVDLEYTVELDEWWFAEGQFPYNGCNQIFAVCEKITAKDIDFHDNQTATIIKEIVHIDFPFLKRLALSMNNIETIQHLQHLKAPSLQTLTLNGNNITQAKSLRKCNFPNLTGISLDENKIIDVSFLQQFHWGKEIKFIFIDCDNGKGQDEGPAVDDITPILKLQASILKKISWDYWRLAKNSRMRNAVASRFTGIGIEGKKY